MKIVPLTFVQIDMGMDREQPCGKTHNLDLFFEMATIEFGVRVGESFALSLLKASQALRNRRPSAFRWPFSVMVQRSMGQGGK